MNALLVRFFLDSSLINKSENLFRVVITNYPAKIDYE